MFSSREPHADDFFYFFFLIIRPPQRSTLFPYTTLFRSVDAADLADLVPVGGADRGPAPQDLVADRYPVVVGDRKSTRLNSSHITISYAVFCLKKKNKHTFNPHCLLLKISH